MRDIKYTIIENLNNLKEKLPDIRNSELKAFLNKNDYHFFCISATHNNNEAGYAIITESRDKLSIFLAKIKLRDDFLKSPEKIGANLVNLLCHTALIKNHSNLFLLSKHEAIPFYEKCGIYPISPKNLRCDSEITDIIKTIKTRYPNLKTNSPEFTLTM